MIFCLEDVALGGQQSSEAAKKADEIFSFLYPRQTFACRSRLGSDAEEESALPPRINCQENSGSGGFSLLMNRRCKVAFYGRVVKQSSHLANHAIKNVHLRKTLCVSKSPTPRTTDH